MMSDLDHLSQNLYSLRSELLEPIITINGVSSLLINKIPDAIPEILHQIENISKKLLSELQLFPREKIDLQSPENAATQLHLIAADWDRETENILHLANKIKTMNIHLGDPSLDRLLNEVILNEVTKFKAIIPYIKAVKAAHLIQKDGFLKILNIEEQK